MPNKYNQVPDVLLRFDLYPRSGTHSPEYIHNMNIYITILLLYIGYSSSIHAHCPAKEFAILSSIAVSYSQVWDMFSQK